MNDPTVEDIAGIMEETPHTLFITITKRGTKILNDLVIDAKFHNTVPLCWVPGDPDGNPDNFSGQNVVSWTPTTIPIYDGMLLILTQNLHKDRDYVNGMRVTVQGVTRQGIRVQTTTGRDLVLYMWTDAWRVTYFPIRSGYATTLHKVQYLTSQFGLMSQVLKPLGTSLYLELNSIQIGETLAS